MKIDVHAHFLPSATFDKLDRDGRSYGPRIRKNAEGKEMLFIRDKEFGIRVASRVEPELIIKDMDKIGLDMRALSILPPGVFYEVNPEDGVSFARRQNDAIAQVVTAYPDRFIGMATLPMQDVSKAVTELERAVRVLGFKAVQILTNVNGKNLDEPEFQPFFQKAQDLDVAIFVHPRPLQAAGIERMQRYFLDNTIGNPLETTIAVASIIFGGVLERFPRLRFAFAHAGGYTPFIRGRWERSYKFVAKSRCNPKPPSEYLKLMYFDTIIHYGPALAYLVATVGADKVVLGSDYDADIGIHDPVRHVRNAAGISAADKQKILEETSVALLKLE